MQLQETHTNKNSQTAISHSLRAQARTCAHTHTRWTWPVLMGGLCLLIGPPLFLWGGPRYLSIERSKTQASPSGRTGFKLV